jgi:hypothetical protein
MSAMDTLPFPQEFVTMGDHFGEKAPHVCPFDSNAEHKFRHSVTAQQVNFRLPRPGHMNMGRFMIEAVDHKSKAMGAMNGDHPSI